MIIIIIQCFSSITSVSIILQIFFYFLKFYLRIKVLNRLLSLLVTLKCLLRALRSTSYLVALAANYSVFLLQEMELVAETAQLGCPVSVSHSSASRCPQDHSLCLYDP